MTELELSRYQLVMDVVFDTLRFLPEEQKERIRKALSAPTAQPKATTAGSAAESR